MNITSSNLYPSEQIVRRAIVRFAFHHTRINLPTAESRIKITRDQLDYEALGAEYPCLIPILEFVKPGESFYDRADIDKALARCQQASTSRTDVPNPTQLAQEIEVFAQRIHIGDWCCLYRSLSRMRVDAVRMGNIVETLN